MSIAKFKEMTEEERKAEALETMSDSIRDLAHNLAMLKAIANDGHGIAPEDFDKAWSRTFNKEWDKLKDKTSAELAIIGLLEMAAHGADMDWLFEESEEK